MPGNKPTPSNGRHEHCKLVPDSSIGKTNMNDSRAAIESLLRWLAPRLDEGETEYLRSRLIELAHPETAQARTAARDPFSLYDVIGSSARTASARAATS